MSGSPAAASNVGSMSWWHMIPLSTEPALILPGQRMKHGTRHAPSKLVSFWPRNGVLAPSGQVSFSGPLSVEYMTRVLSAMPKLIKLVEHLADLFVVDDHAITVWSWPLLPRFFSATCVLKCMAVELYHRKKGLFALTCFSIQPIAAAVISSSTVSMRFFVSGPVSSMVCLPIGPKRGSVVAHRCRLPCSGGRRGVQTPP